MDFLVLSVCTVGDSLSRTTVQVQAALTVVKAIAQTHYQTDATGLKIQWPYAPLILKRNEEGVRYKTADLRESDKTSVTTLVHVAWSYVSY